MTCFRTSPNRWGARFPFSRTGIPPLQAYRQRHQNVLEVLAGLEEAGGGPVLEVELHRLVRDDLEVVYHKVGIEDDLERLSSSDELGHQRAHEDGSNRGYVRCNNGDCDGNSAASA